jgi:hypothetical protein
VSAQVVALREALERRFPGTSPLVHHTAPVVALGVDALERACPNGGLPRGRLTAWSPGAGATAVLRRACRTTTHRGERAVWVDGAGTLTGEAWRRGGGLLVRPRGREEALECAEELTRSAGFALVVLTGAATEEAERVRLARAAREGGGALVTLDANGFMAGLRVALRLQPAGYRWRRDPFGEPAEVESVMVHARVAALGWSRETTFPLGVACHDLRLSLERTLADRRGAAG